MTVPVYIAEVSPSHLRGQLVTINTLFITGGQFVASVVDGVFSYLPHDGWRWVQMEALPLESFSKKQSFFIYILLCYIFFLPISSELSYLSGKNAATQYNS